MEEKIIIIGVISAVIVVIGLLCDCVATAVFYVGAFRLCLFLYSVFGSIRRHFLRSPLDLENRYGSGSWVFVTGAANGIGLEQCKQFASKNFNLIMLDREEDSLQNCKTVINHTYPKVQIETIVCDLSKLTTVEAAEEVIAKLNDKDLACLVNNAGIADFIPFNEENPQSILNIIQITNF